MMRVLLLGLPVLAVGAIALVPQPQPTPLLPSSAGQPCAASGFEPLPGPIAAAIIPQDGGFTLTGEAWLRGNACAAGTLTVVGRGKLGGDELPQLTVMLDGDVLAAPRFGAEQQTISIRVPRAGQLYAGFLNDFYQSEVRIASMSSFQLLSPSCGGVSPGPASNLSVPWEPGKPSVSLLDARPLVLTPCAAGVLTFRAAGRQGAGAFPMLELSQGGKVLLQVQTQAERKPIRVTVGAAPVTIALTNPYFQTLANRDLIGLRLAFTAD